MHRLEQSLIAFGATAALLVGCTGSSEQDAITQDPACHAQFAPGYAPGGPPPEDSMQVTYHETDDVDHNLAEVQKRTGSAAVSALISESICLKANDTIYTATLSIPENPAARGHTVVFTGDSKNVGQVFKAAGKRGLEHLEVSATNYRLDVGPSGEMVRNSPALSVVGQSDDLIGPQHSVATERCQPLAMATTPELFLDGRLIYASIKEAICNALGGAAKAAYAGLSYEDYADRYSDSPLGGQNNPAELEMDYPLLSEQQYGLLAVRPS